MIVYTALFVFSESIKEFFSVDFVNIYLFSTYHFLIDFGRWKSVWLPRPTYDRDSSTLRDIFYSFVLIGKNKCLIQLGN